MRLLVKILKRNDANVINPHWPFHFCMK